MNQTNEPKKVPRAALCQLWCEAKSAESEFLERASALQTEFIKQHNLKHNDVSLSFSLENGLLVGIEVREGSGRKMLHADDLRDPKISAVASHDIKNLLLGKM